MIFLSHTSFHKRHTAAVQGKIVLAMIRGLVLMFQTVEFPVEYCKHKARLTQQEALLYADIVLCVDI